MNKWEGLQTFWSGFGLTAYDAYSVPNDAELPYITYESQTSDLGGVLSLNGSLWYRGASWTEVVAKAKQIDDALIGGMVIPLDEGYLWINKGTPFTNRLNDATDESIKRIIVNIQAEYLAN